MVPAFKPNDTPFASPKVIALKRFEVVPPLTRMFERVTAFESIAVVMYGPILTEIPLLAIVPLADVPANAAEAATKSLPRLDAIAVVNALCEAVIAAPLKPNESPFAFENAPMISLPVAASVKAWVAFQWEGRFS